LNKKNIEKLLSKTAIKIPPSGIRKFFDIVASMPDCISLGVGEPDFTTPWRISDSGIYSLKEGNTHYTSNRGLLELREKISDYMEEKYSLRYNPNNEILITLGVSQGLDLALRSIINPGDEIIIFEPCYVSYSANISMLYGVPVPISTSMENNFQIEPEKIEKAITSKTKAILLNYPSNPTGITIDKKILEKISGIAQKYNLIVLSDEIYSAITYDKKHASIASLPGMKERTIVLNGFSKSHAMTGWRLGFNAAPEHLINVMVKIHQYTALCAPSMSQYAAIEAIEKGDKDVLFMKKEYQKRGNYISSRFNEMGLKCLMPQGAFYVFPDISTTRIDSENFALKLLQEKNVAVVPGTAFGEAGKNHIRCSFATSLENIKEALNRIENFLGKIKDGTLD